MEHDLQQAINAWKRQVNEEQKTSYARSVRYSRYHYWIGLAATLLVVLVTVQLWVRLEDSTYRIPLGILGVSAALLTALQTVFSQARRAERHRLVTSQLVHLRRDIELFERFLPERQAERESRALQMLQKSPYVPRVRDTIHA